MAMNGISGINPAMTVQPINRDESRDMRRVNEPRVSDQDNNRQQMDAQVAPTNTQAEAQLAAKRVQTPKETQPLANEYANDLANQASQSNQLNLAGGKTRGALVDLLA